MTIFTDTESAHIPCDMDGRALFDCDLTNWGEGKGPELAINIPVYFKYGKAGKETSYDSCGILTVPIQEILNEYIETGGKNDGFNGAKEFANWLRVYADRLDKAAAKCA